MFDLTNKIAVVTGASSGIGAGIAERFARAGARVYFVDLDEEGGTALAARLAGEGLKAHFLRGDVSDAPSCRRVAETVLGENDARCDILVNNAGVGHVGTILTTTREDLDRMYLVNVVGIFNMTQAFLPAMIARGAGSVINIASIGGIIGIQNRFGYNATKFAAVGMTKSMALDYPRSGVRFNCICPGRIQTPFMDARINAYPDPEKAHGEMVSTHPIGRMGTPEEVAGAAHYLASDESLFVTGGSLIIDGGWSVGKIEGDTIQ